MDRADIHGIELEVAHIPGPQERAPLVFLHEGLGSVSMWTQRGRDWPRELCAATGRAGWLYSRRGYGQSDPVPDVRDEPRGGAFWHAGRHEPDYMHLEARQVLPELLRQLNVDRPVLIGHSDGASIALLHASQFPVTACVVIAPHVFVEDIAIRSIDEARRLYEHDPGERGLRQRLERYHADVDNAFYQWNDVWLSAAFRHFDIRADCRTIHTPLLAIQGLNDEYGSLQQLREIEAHILGAQTLELSSCGHSPHRDQPEQLTDAIARFLNSVP
ncbi:alpha/beta fold hydrolase [Hydrogenophaga sp. A37]|uniref:alpha/beta fold hydrolase n=1 Tax=Hydrogenophaga sp. A37 TaxID=1945864 RepID=UPI000984B34C|nr:alpha/beta hydrolase [Hydrogenophaga sp. A37]OOG79629.1 alpha/beta hydrolase [Hydrogenophaga sp. A37]